MCFPNSALIKRQEKILTKQTFFRWISQGRNHFRPCSQSPSKFALLFYCCKLFYFQALMFMQEHCLHLKKEKAYSGREFTGSTLKTMDELVIAFNLVMEPRVRIPTYDIHTSGSEAHV